MLHEAIDQALETPNVDTLLLRRTFPELESSLLAEFRRDILPKWIDAYGFSYNDSKHTARWPNGSTTRFGYCQNANDVYQYQGGEFLFIGLDELTMFTLGQWQFLTSRNRCAVRGTFPNMAGATNPGNIGHAWVKALFIDKVPASGMDRPEQYDPSEYDFISAFVWDNPIYANDEAYLKTLNALPTHLRAAFLEGDWNVFAGAYFDCLVIDPSNPNCHIRDLKDNIEPWASRWISIDAGFVHSAAVHWHATIAEGLHNTYREFVQPNLTPRMLAAAIIEQTKGEKIDDVYLSPDAFAKRTNFETEADQLTQEFKKVGLPAPQMADNDRVGGWILMYSLLQANQWTIDPSCKKLISGLQAATHEMPPKNIEDIKKTEDDGDDCIDCARYGIKSRLSLAPIPRNIQIAQAAAVALAKTNDMSLTMLHKKKFEESLPPTTPHAIRRVHPMMRRWQRGTN